ncbi:MAG: HD domain-containing protein [Candidatus Moranbacteria bacterium]|nr:HD domain-containing protein [Candidatus Moranbacteria bacterium]
MVKIPLNVIEIGKKLQENNLEAYLVGGCVRDLLLGNSPKDWDVATNALPRKTQKIFPNSFYENKFGTVAIKPKDEKNSIVEVTTYRKDGDYKDYRHPQKVEFSQKIQQDLKRRDFTINAMAVNLENISSKPSLKEIMENLKDPFGGRIDLNNKTVRCVGKAEERFKEDALRLIRAIRFCVILGFSLEKKTQEGLKKAANLLEFVSKERIRDEFIKIIKSPRPQEGIELLRKNNLLSHVIPELEYGVGINQNLHHIYTVYDHSLLALKNCPSKKLSVRLAALLHDIAKPQTKRGRGKNSTFYNHDLVGAGVVRKILKRLRFSSKTIEKVVLLVKNHMFYYEVDNVSESSVRRLLKKVGRKNIKDLIDLRIADRLGSGCPKAKPYKLRHLEYLIEKVSKDPISVKMLRVDGDLLKTKAKIKPGPKMGAILDVLLSEVIEDPGRNNQQYLMDRAKELKKENLEKISQKAKEKIEDKKIEEDRVLKRKFWVK